MAQTYTLSFFQRARTAEDDLDDHEKKEIQSFVNATLGLMTAGCEVCKYSNGPYCDKLRRPVKLGDSRCQLFERRPSAQLTR